MGIPAINVVTDVSPAADPSGVNDSTPAFTAALAMAEANNGGIVFVPSGTYRLSAPLSVANYVKMMGPSTLRSAVLDFQNLCAGVTLQNSRSALEALAIQNCVGHGVLIGDGRENYLRDVGVSSVSGSAFKLVGSYLTTLERCFASMADFGFRLDKSQTTISLTACCAELCKSAGFSINGTIYSSLTACAAERCGDQWNGQGPFFNDAVGYMFTNCQSIVMNACGAEANRSTAIFIAASDQLDANDASGIAEGFVDGITINSFRDHNNNLHQWSVCGSFLTLAIDNGRRIRGTSQNHFTTSATTGAQVVKRGPSASTHITFPVQQGGVTVA